VFTIRDGVAALANAAKVEQQNFPGDDGSRCSFRERVFIEVVQKIAP